MSDILDAILERGDLAHLALFLWACVATVQAHLALRELGEAHRRAYARRYARGAGPLARAGGGAALPA